MELKATKTVPEAADQFVGCAMGPWVFVGTHGSNLVGLIILKQTKAEKRSNRQSKSRKLKSFQKSRKKQKVNRPDLLNPTSFSLDFSLELFFFSNYSAKADIVPIDRIESR